MDEVPPLPASVIIQAGGSTPAAAPATDTKTSAAQSGQARRVNGMPAWMTSKPAMVAGLAMLVLVEVLIYAATGSALWWAVANLVLGAGMLIVAMIRRAAMAKASTAGKAGRSSSAKSGLGHGGRSGHGRTGLGRLFGGRGKSGHGPSGAGLGGKSGHGGRSGHGRTGLGRLFGGRGKSGHGTSGAGHSGHGGRGRGALSRLLGSRGQRPGSAGNSGRGRGHDRTGTGSGKGGHGPGGSGNGGRSKNGNGRGSGNPGGGKPGTGSGAGKSGPGHGGSDDGDDGKPLSLIEIARQEYARGKAERQQQQDESESESGEIGSDDETKPDEIADSDEDQETDLTNVADVTDNGQDDNGGNMGKYDGMSLQALARAVRPSGEVTTALAAEGAKLDTHIAALHAKIHDLDTALADTALAPQAKSIVEDAERQLRTVVTSHETVVKQIAAIGASLDLFWATYAAHHADAEDRVNGVGGTVAQHTKSDVRQAHTEI